MNEQNEHNEQKSAYDSLENVYQRAVDLRLDQHTHQSIATILSNTGYKVKEHTVRVWFMKGGKCYNAFNEIRELRMNDLKELIEKKDSILEEATYRALVLINRILKDALINDTFTPFVFRVCQDVLDRGGIPRQTQSSVDARLDDTAQKSMSQMADDIRSIIEGNRAFS